MQVMCHLIRIDLDKPVGLLKPNLNMPVGHIENRQRPIYIAHDISGVNDALVLIQDNGKRQVISVNVWSGGDPMWGIIVTTQQLGGLY